MVNRHMDLKKIIKETQEVIYKKLNTLLPEDSEILTKTMRYSLLGTGKRLRPLLVMESAKIFNAESTEDLITVASAIEMIHVFSLIHDDLPAMDNDDYRRGEPTAHKKFNEHDAILAGDSLIALAFEIIIEKTPHLDYEKRCRIVLIIAKAIGYRGMCLGQSMDIAFEKSNRQKSYSEAEMINTYKTGYLFKACVEIGCILGRANKKDTEALIEYAINFGKAFQLMDDLEDREIIQGGRDNTKKTILQLVESCKNILDRLKNKNNKSIDVLKLIAEFCIS